ncbi:hypothetical protein [Streptomyces hundungensis]|uniref:hypothetical protein n=1 Tax=Streptomyces hundungensis TaxID=1077946 RepID=UPI0031E563EF
MTSTTMPVELLLRNLKCRPSMFFLDGSFAQYISFLSGFGVSSAAAGEPFLDGFAEWISANTENGRNLTWPTLVLRSIWPEWNGSASDWGELDSIADEHAVRALFGLLAAYKGVDPGVLGLANDRA